MFGLKPKTGDIRFRKALGTCCAACSTALGEAATSCPHCEQPRPEAGWAPLDQLADPWLGRLVHGRYLIRRRIGHGGSAIVYLASLHPSNRPVAVKIVNLQNEPGNHSQGTAKRRFECESSALAHLNSPHVLQLIDIVELVDEHVGLVTEFVDGETLGQIVRNHGRLDIPRALELAHQIAIAVSQVHASGMAHRDLKPDNIIIERLHRDDEFVHLIDFGIAHTIGQDSETTGFIGTPLYASPEQSRGDELDFRTDIYSFGAMLFHVLVGQPPFTGTNPYQLLTKHVRETAPALSDVADDREFPDELEWLVAEMLRKAADQRPSSMKEVADRLRGIARIVDVRRGRADVSQVREFPGAAILHGSRMIPFERAI